MVCFNMLPEYTCQSACTPISFTDKRLAKYKYRLINRKQGEKLVKVIIFYNYSALFSHHILVSPQLARTLDRACAKNSPGHQVLSTIKA